MHEERYSLFRGHGADNPTQHCVIGPAQLLAPWPGFGNCWGRDAGVHDIDLRRRDAAVDHGCFHCLRYRDEPSDALAVLESAARGEGNPSRHDEGQAKADEGGEGDGVGTRIVRMNEVRPPCSDDPAHAGRGCQVPLPPHAHTGRRQPGSAQAPYERGVILTDDERLVTGRTLGPGQQKNLPLSAAPVAAAIDVQESQRHAG